MIVDAYDDPLLQPTGPELGQLTAHPVAYTVTLFHGPLKRDRRTLRARRAGQPDRTRRPGHPGRPGGALDPLNAL